MSPGGKRNITSSLNLEPSVLEAFANGSDKVYITFTTIKNPYSLLRKKPEVRYDKVADKTIVDIFKPTNSPGTEVTVQRRLEYIRQKESDYQLNKK
jgi:hypothetical protein